MAACQHHVISNSSFSWWVPGSGATRTRLSSLPGGGCMTSRRNELRSIKAWHLL